MNDTETATYMRDMLSRRLSGFELALVSAIADGLHLNVLGSDWTDPNDRRAFEGLKTQFAAELANAGKAVTP